MPLLEVRGLSHSFGGLRAVQDVSLTLERGELVGLIGPNGAGKTTVFNLITGVYRPDEGEVLFEGRPITGLPSHRITGLGIARTFQNIRLFRDLTALDNVRVARFSRLGYGFGESILQGPRFLEREEEIRREAMELLEMFQIAHYAHVPARHLPYGDQRRLEIARAMATRPKLLLLDEPAAGMNPAEIQRLMELIAWLQDRFAVTILLIEHQMRLVMGICRRIIVLHFGRVLVEGTPERVRRDPRVLEAYLGEEVTGP